MLVRTGGGGEHLLFRACMGETVVVLLCRVAEPLFIISKLLSYRENAEVRQINDPVMG